MVSMGDVTGMYSAYHVHSTCSVAVHTCTVCTVLIMYTVHQVCVHKSHLSTVTTVG